MATELPDTDELAVAVLEARKAAHGDSNDGEISALQYALDVALNRLDVTVRSLTDDEIEAAGGLI